MNDFECRFYSVIYTSQKATITISLTEGGEHEYSTTFSRSQTVGTEDIMQTPNFSLPLRICYNPSNVPNLNVLRKTHNAQD